MIFLDLRHVEGSEDQLRNGRQSQEGIRLAGKEFGAYDKPVSFCLFLMIVSQAARKRE